MPNKEELTKFVLEQIEKYTEGEDDDEFLWATFQEDFDGMNGEGFKRSALINLRHALRARGAWVEMKAAIWTALYRTTIENKRVRWSDKEILEIMSETQTHSKDFDYLVKRMKDSKVASTPAQLQPLQSTALPTPALSQLPVQPSQLSGPPAAQIPKPNFLGKVPSLRSPTGNPFQQPTYHPWTYSKTEVS